MYIAIFWDFCSQHVVKSSKTFVARFQTGRMHLVMPGRSHWQVEKQAARVDIPRGAFGYVGCGWYWAPHRNMQLVMTLDKVIKSCPRSTQAHAHAQKKQTLIITQRLCVRVHAVMELENDVATAFTQYSAL